MLGTPKIIQIVNNLNDFTIKEPYEAAIPGVFHGALYEKARVAPWKKASGFAVCRARASLFSRRQALRFPAIKAP
jgi:hypothetical protein